ncbi:MAG: DUF1588 domain-containing protein [Planctomycetota bacterium]
MKRRRLYLCVVFTGLAALWLSGGTPSPEQSAHAAPPSDLEGRAQRILQSHCIACHGPDEQKGLVRFDALETIDTVDQQTLFVRAQESVHFEEMPPAKAKQLTEEERGVLLAWFKDKLTGTAAKKLEEKLQRPEAGNYVDHDALFSGQHADLPGYTYDRRWLINEYIFNEKFNRILKYTPTRDIDGTRRRVQGDSKRRVNLTNPFLLPGYKGGVRYYANETLNGGHLLTMLTNAKNAADYMLTELVPRDRNYLPAARQIMESEDRNQATLEARQRFLSIHIERVLVDLYGQEHEALLPAFVRVEIPEPIVNDLATKKAPFHAANPGRVELELIFRSMRRLERPGQTDAALIEACEREWFNHGHDERKIQARITFLNNYMVEWRSEIKKHRYDERTRRHEYRPLDEQEMRVIADTIREHRKRGDNFKQIIDKCVAQWRDEFERQRIAAGAPPEDQVRALVDQVFAIVLERAPTANEADEYTLLAKSYAENLGRRPAIGKLIQTLLLNTEFVYRFEFGQGEADEHGRRMLAPRDASYALAYALTDASPDKELAQAAERGRLNTRADYEREVRRMLANRDQFYVVDESVDKKDVPNFTSMPVRELRFFREFFGYPKMLSIFKDDKRFGGSYANVRRRVVAEADMIVEYILEKDQDVFNNLLTTDSFFVYHSGDNDAMRVASERIQKIYNYFKDMDWRSFTVEDLAKHKDFIAETQMRGIDPKRLDQAKGRYNPIRAFMTQMESFELRLSKGQTGAAPYPSFPSHGFNGAYNRYGGRMQSPEIARMFSIDMADWDYPTVQPTRIERRKGILTHPAWLIAFAQNTETDPIHRGKWIQNHLLAGTIPDVPITVDAVIPPDPHKTLRQRMIAKTGNAYCWTCHQKMEPLGLPFEMYDDFGRFRTEERLEYPENLLERVRDKQPPHVDMRDVYKTLPVETQGRLEGTGDSMLDGDVQDALDLIDRLAQSDRVRQSIIRHAFRYFMGRNETLSDSKTLIDADRAYLESGGSFDEVIVSLLTSDSFMYRKPYMAKD